MAWAKKGDSERLIFHGRIELKARGVGKLFLAHNFFVTFSINNPRWIISDLGRVAFVRLGRVSTVRAALHVRQPGGRGSEDFFLLLAVRTPEGAIHFCAALAEVNRQGSRGGILLSGRLSQYARVIQVKNYDDGEGDRYCFAQPGEP